MSFCITYFTNQIVKVEFYSCISRQENTGIPNILSSKKKSKKDIDKILTKISTGVPNSSQEGGSQSGDTGDC